VREIAVEKFFDGEQNNRALFLFPEARDFPLGFFAVIERHKKSFRAGGAAHGGLESVNVGTTDLVFLLHLNRIFNVSRGGFVAVVESPFLARLRPEDFVIAIGIKRRVYVNQINAGVGQFLELIQIVAAINDAGVHERRRF